MNQLFLSSSPITGFGPRASTPICQDLDISPFQVRYPQSVTPVDLTESASDSLVFLDVSTVDDDLTSSPFAFVDITQSSMEICTSPSTSLPNVPVFSCCENDCMTAIPEHDMELLQKSYNSRSRLDQQQFLIDILSASACGAEITSLKKFSLLGRSVCREAFAKVMGVSKKRLQNIQRFPRDSLTASRVIRLFRKSEKYTVTRSWMKRYFERIGDRMPHIQQIHLPSFLSKKTVYDTMIKELSEQGHDEVLSLSHFYALWKEEFPFCTIPKVIVILVTYSTCQNTSD